MIIREIQSEDVEGFWDLLNTLDTETNYMMYEPGERQQKTTIQELRDDIDENVIHGNDFLQTALDDGKIVGYIRAERGKFNRVYHTAYIVAGILEAYSGKGIGTSFFKNLDQWAKTNGVTRLELTVECCNHAAKHLYEKSGFKVEGIREKSMLVNGVFVDEFYMAKIFRQKTLEERAAEFGGTLKLDGEFDWGEAVGREIYTE